MELVNEQYGRNADTIAEAPRGHVGGAWVIFKRRLLKKDGKRFRKYIETTSINGVPYIFISKSVIRRLFWLVVVLAAVSVSLYNITDRILYLVDQPTATTISVSRPSELTFPVVTICNPNVVRRSYLESLHLSETITRILNDEFFSTDGFNVSRCTGKLFAEIDSIKANFGVDASLDLSSIGVDGRMFLELFVLECTYQGIDCKDLPYDPWSYTFVDQGACYSFNTGDHGEPLTVNGTGTRHALKLVLNIQQEEYTSLAGTEAGVKIHVHPQGTPSEPDQIGIAIPPGRGAFIALKERRIDDKSSNANCKKSSETDSFNIVPYEHYSTTGCNRNCYLTNAIETCGCIWSSIKDRVDTTLPVCTEQHFCCFQDQYASARSCNKICPSACTYTEYTQTASYAAFPAKYLIDSVISRMERLLKGNHTYYLPAHVAKTLHIYDNVTIDRQFLEDNLLSVYIYFEDLSYETAVTEDAYSSPALLSDIGGQLGLFIGVSVISMMEFVLWIVDESNDRCCGINEKVIMGWIRKAWHRVAGKNAGRNGNSLTSGIELEKPDQGGET